MSLNSTDIREIRKFGTIALIFFGCLTATAIWKQKLIFILVFGLLALLGLGFILLPRPLSPVYNRWMKIAHFIGTVVTTIILTLAYYLVITPAALIKRVLGGRPLPLKPDPGAASYWVIRSEPAQPRERFKKRY